MVKDVAVFKESLELRNAPVAVVDISICVKKSVVQLQQWQIVACQWDSSNVKKSAAAFSLSSPTNKAS